MSIAGFVALHVATDDAEFSPISLNRRQMDGRLKKAKTPGHWNPDAFRYVM